MYPTLGKARRIVHRTCDTGEWPVILQRYDSAALAAAALAEQVVAALRIGLSWRGAASLAVPGGRTPVGLFRALRDAELDWPNVAITLTDERWVPESDPASNAALVRAELLQGRAAAARFLPLYNGTASAAAATTQVWESLRAAARPFDAVVLGMGEDGHFGSLFPDDPGVAAALDVKAVPGCVAMQAPVIPAERISMNLAAYLQSRRVFLLVSGEVKRELLLSAARREAGADLPVTTLMAQRLPMPEVYWSP
jgi:6-phosphogluconolactonase